MAGASAMRGVRTVPRVRARRVRRPVPRGAAVALALLGSSVLVMLVVGWLHAPSRDLGALSRTSRRHCAARGARDAKRPRPLVVVSAGGLRAGSTVLFNALRILLRIRDPNTVSGWHEDLTALHAAYGGGDRRADLTINGTSAVLSAFRGVGSLLVKVHLVQDWMRFSGSTNLSADADAVFVSHRDVRDAVRSTRAMGWAAAVAPAALADPDFCVRPPRHRPRRLSEAELGHSDTWVLLARANVVCRGKMLRSAGTKLKEDLRAEDFRDMDQEGAVRFLSRLGRHLDYEYSNEELSAAARELLMLRPPECVPDDGNWLEVNPVTHFHRGHVHGKDAQVEESVRSGTHAIAKDPMCREWLVKHGYGVE